MSVPAAYVGLIATPGEVPLERKGAPDVHLIFKSIAWSVICWCFVIFGRLTVLTTPCGGGSYPIAALPYAGGRRPYGIRSLAPGTAYPIFIYDSTAAGQN